MIIQTPSVPWNEVARLWGPLGIFFVFGIIILAGVAILGRKLLLDTIADARAERNYMREQNAKKDDKFLEALRFRDEQFRPIADAIDRIRRR